MNAFVYKANLSKCLNIMTTSRYIKNKFYSIAAKMHYKNKNYRRRFVPNNSGTNLFTNKVATMAINITKINKMIVFMTVLNRLSLANTLPKTIMQS